MCDLPLTGLRLGCLGLLSALSIACQQERAERTVPTPTTNVILISIDTLRPDHLGCYGYEKPTSPNLDLFCQESVVFRQAIAQAPSTLHSHASMLSSLLPHHHGASWSGKTRLPERAVTLAEALQSAGYATAAFTGGGQMDEVFGLDQGFDLYEHPGKERFEGTVERGIEWLDQTASRPFFLFLHSYEVHHPYTPIPEYLEAVEEDYQGPLPDEISIDLLRAINRQEVSIDDADLAHIVATYDAEIRSVDQGMARLISALEERDLYEDSLILFTSDHGEEFGEHGVVGWHSHTLYDELLRVPLLIRFPGGRSAGATIAAQVRVMDIPPSVLVAVGLEIPEEFDGMDLGELLDAGEVKETFAISRMDRPTDRDISSIRSSEWKMIQRALYDLTKDPDEQWDTAFNDRETLAALAKELEEEVDRRERMESEEVLPSDATLDELRSLGYLQ